MTAVFVNPGTGHVIDYAPRVREAWARSNMLAFAMDVGMPSSYTLLRRAPVDGRWAFELRYAGAKSIVGMPGCSLARVRYMGRDNQNIWDFPRLYVDGFSLAWLYAVDAIASCPWCGELECRRAQDRRLRKCSAKGGA